MAYRLKALEDLLAWAEAGGDETLRFRTKDGTALREGDKRPTGDLYVRAAVADGWELDWRRFGYQKPDTNQAEWSASFCFRDNVPEDLRMGELEAQRVLDMWARSLTPNKGPGRTLEELARLVPVAVAARYSLDLSKAEADLLFGLDRHVHRLSDEEDHTRRLAFLRMLRERAEGGLENLPDELVEMWSGGWLEANRALKEQAAKDAKDSREFRAAQLRKLVLDDDPDVKPVAIVVHARHGGEGKTHHMPLTREEFAVVSRALTEPTSRMR